VLDIFSLAAAFILTATWDVVAWNKTAALIWPNMGQSAGYGHNTLRMFFLEPQAKTLSYDWEAVARMAVGAMAEVAAMVDELSRSSSTFRAMSQEHDVSDSANARKDLRHPVLETISFEASTFGVDGRQDLTMMVFLPASTDVAQRITALLAK
jgi:hypothetical protein